MDNLTTKRCTKCGKTQPLTNEYFGKRADQKDGFKTICRNCFREYGIARSRKLGYQPLNRSIVEGNKRQCNRCKKWYPNTHKYFSKEKRVKSGMSCKCVFCQRKLVSEHRLKTGKIDPLKNCLYAERRKARQLGLPDTLTIQQWNHALVYFNHSCAVCGRFIGLWHTIAMDHWMPLSDNNCPGTIAKNIVPLCHGLDGCNNKKRNRNPVEWLTDTYGKRKANKILRRIEQYFNSL